MNEPTVAVIIPVWPLLILIGLSLANLVMSAIVGVLRWQNGRLTKKLVALRTDTPNTNHPAARETEKARGVVEEQHGGNG